MAPTPRAARAQDPTGVHLVGFRRRLDALHPRDGAQGGPGADAVAEVERERRHYQELFELAPEAYVVTDGGGVVCEANRAALQLLNATRAELHGRPLMVHLTGAERPRLLERINALHRGEAVLDWDTVIAPRDAPRLRVAVRCAADAPAGGGATIRWMLRSIGEWSGDDEGEAGGEGDSTVLRAEARRLAALDKVKSDFLDLVSHELRSPIGVARGYVSMLDDGTLGELTPRAASVLPVVMDKLDEMARLVEQMLDTARLEESHLELDIARVDVRDVAADAVAAMRPSKRHTVVLECDDGEMVCDADAPRLLTVIANLLDNAVKYSPAGGEVLCSAFRQGDTARVSVRDHGIGLDQAGLSRLFTRFGRVPTAASAGIPGTGLGLYLARELARRHGGDISVASQPGVGSTFTLALPLHHG